MKPTRHIPLTISALAACLAVATAVTCAAGGGETFTDAKTAAEKSPAFNLQGEYVGDMTDRGETFRAGLQIVALGNDRFIAVFYPGGLPGETEKFRPKQISGTVVDGKLVLAEHPGGDDRFEVADGVAAFMDGTEIRGKLNRVTRRSPTDSAAPPDGAVVLFDGTEKSLENWKDATLTEAGFLKQGTQTTRDFGSFSLHIEFMLPFKPDTKPGSQNRGNSGVYIHNRYEVQVLDAFGLPYYHLPEDQWKTAFEKDFGFKPESDRKQWTGSLYQFRHPAVNASYPPLAWQTYDIDFTAAKFDAAGKKTANARITVKHNGVVIQDDLELPHGTGAGKARGEVPAGPIVLQEHANPVAFRNIWIVPR